MRYEYLASAKRLYNNFFYNILILIAAFLGSAIVSMLFIYISNQEIDTNQRILTRIVFDSVFIICFFTMHRIKSKDSFYQLWGNNSYKIIFTALIIVPFVYGFKEVFICIIQGQTTIELNTNSDPKLLSYAFLMVIVGAILEELVFRAYLLRTIYSYTNSTVIAVLLSSILFAIVHIGKNYDDIISLISIFITGIILSIIVIKTGSLWLVTVIHILHNLGYFILFNEEYSIFQKLYAYDSTLIELIYENLQGIIICILLLITFRMYKKKNSENNFEIGK